MLAAASGVAGLAFEAAAAGGAAAGDAAAEDAECAVCMAELAGAQARLRPCGHTTLCAGCAGALLEAPPPVLCPMCRAPFARFDEGAFAVPYAPHPDDR